MYGINEWYRLQCYKSCTTTHFKETPGTYFYCNRHGNVPAQVLQKAELMRLKQVQHVLDEKKLLLEIRHPFIVTL